MNGPFEELAGLDKTIHEPARLAICTALASCERADFLYLQRLTGLSRGNLSAHLTRLETAGVVAIEKGFEGRIPRTRVALTAHGRQAIDDYWVRMDTLRKDSDRWVSDDESPQRPGPVGPR